MQSTTTQYNYKYSPSLYIPRKYNPPTNTDFAYINMPSRDPEFIKLLIGKDGAIFKLITTLSFVDYIWYNRELGIIEVWGHYNNIVSALKLLSDRIDAINANY